MNGRSIAGVVLGGIVDIVSTNVLVSPLVIYVLLRDHLVGAAEGGIALSRAMSGEPALSAAMWCLGAAASVIGGYTAAWIARRNELLVGALSAYLCTVFGVIGLLHDTSGTPLAQHLVGFLVSPALGVLGGYLRRLQTQRRLARA